MKKLFLIVAFFAGITIAGSAQTTKTPAAGTNRDANAPVNVADPSQRPAQPATYSATPVGQGQTGQFYVKNGKPVDAAGNPIVPVTNQPSKEELQKMQNSKAIPPHTPNTDASQQGAQQEKYRTIMKEQQAKPAVPAAKKAPKKSSSN